MISSLKSMCIFAFLLLVSIAALGQTHVPDARHPDEHWRTRLKELLPLLGHRNWIAVVDSAYPLQVSPGIETIETDGNHLEIVRRVLHEVADTKHVRPVIFADAELNAVPETDASGVTYYRDSLNHFLEGFEGGGLEAQFLPHEQIISKLDQAGQTFRVLVLKTRMTIPYTSVFIRLDCAYWSDEQEKRLREKMPK